MDIPTSEELRARLGDLPQELYNQIWNTTFTAEPGMRDLISQSRRGVYRTHLKLLPVDTSSRAYYARNDYDEGTGFRPVAGEARPAMRCFLKSLPLKHRLLLRDIVFLVSPSMGSRDKRGMRRLMVIIVHEKIPGAEHMEKHLYAGLVPENEMVDVVATK